MVNEFQIELEQHKLLLKRIYHPELPLTYHVHFSQNAGTGIFRIMLSRGTWKLIIQPLPFWILLKEKELINIIQKNESSSSVKAVPQLSKFAIHDTSSLVIKSDFCLKLNTIGSIF